MTKRELVEHNLNYIRNRYNMPFLKANMLVDINGTKYQVVDAEGDLKLKELYGKRVVNAHPTWQTTYYDNDFNIIADYKE